MILNNLSCCISGRTSSQLSLSQMPDELVLFPMGCFTTYMTKEGRAERVGERTSPSLPFSGERSISR